MTPSPDSFSSPDLPPLLEATLADDGLETERLSLGERLVVSVSAFFSALTDTGYQGAVCIEVEDRAYEGSLETRKRSLRQSKRYLEQFM